MAKSNKWLFGANEVIVLGVTGALVLLVLIVAGGKDTKTSLSYVDETYKYGLNPPEGWQWEDDPLTKSLTRNILEAVKFIEPTTPYKQTSLTIAIEKKVLPLDGHVLALQEMLPHVYGNETDIRIQDQLISVGGERAYVVTYHVPESITEYLPLAVKQVVLEHDEKIYSLIFSVPADKYEEYEPLFDAAVTSFTFLD